MDLARLRRTLHPRRLGPALRWLRRRDAPWLVAWMLTERCNQSCAHCACWRDPTPELSASAAMAYAREMVASGVLAVSFCGGEVLLRDDLGGLLRLLADRGVTSRVTTNGLLVPARLDELRAVTTLKLSVDGPAEIHDAVRGAGAFHGAERALDAARSAGIPVQINTVLSRALVARLDDHLAQIGAWGVSVTFQLPELRHEDALDEVAALLPEPADLRRGIDRLLALVRGRDRRIGNSAGTLRLMRRWPQLEAVDCHAGRRFCRVLADGRVVVCDRPVAPVPLPAAGSAVGFAAGVAGLRRAGHCEGCWRNNTMEINRALGGARDAFAVFRRWI